MAEIHLQWNSRWQAAPKLEIRIYFAFWAFWLQDFRATADIKSAAAFNAVD